jgi:soluble lytic murein transglycosylase-like protein
MFAITMLKAVLHTGMFVPGRSRPPFWRVAAGRPGRVAPHSFGERPVRAWVLVAILSGAAGPAWAEPVAEDQATHEEKIAAVQGAEAPPPAGRGIAPSAVAGHAQIVMALDREARRLGLPPEIADAVTHTESRFNQAAIGGDGEIGLMQVLPSTARMMGFSGSLAELAVPETNIRYGVGYLAQAWRLARGDLCTAVMKYRAGHGETRFSHLSVDYCLKVRSRLTARGFAVTGTVPVATFGNPAGAARLGGRCRGTCLAGSPGGANLVALNDKLNQIVVKVTVIKVPTR